MDTFSHALWGGGLFGYRGHILIALFFGAFPDLISFGLWIPSYFMANGLSIGPPSFDSLPLWLYTTYNTTHSLIVSGSVVVMVACWRKDIAFAMLAWPFHIVLDIPFHTADFFPTEMLWPFSDFVIDGIAWSNPWIWFSNIAGLFVLYLNRWRQNREPGKAK